MGRAPARSRRQAPDGRVPCSALDGRCAPARPALHVSTRFRTCGAVGTRSRAESPSGVRRPYPVLRLGWPMRSGASGVAHLDALPYVWRGRDALPREAAVRRPTAVSRATPWMADALRRVRRCTSRRVSAPVGAGRDALPRGAAVRCPTAVSRAAPWMANALRRVRRCTSQRVSAPVGAGRDALPRGAAVRRPTAVSRAAPWMANALRRVRRCTSRPAILSFCIRPVPLLRLL